MYEIASPTEPLTFIPVLHTCGHFELRYTRWSRYPDSVDAGYVAAGNACCECGQEGRAKQPIFETLTAAQAEALAKNDAQERTNANKREKLEARADKARGAGEALLESADRIASFIPMGQPILVGHHSERRHRNDLKRIQNNTTKGCELLRYSEELERRAASVGTGAISSDDPEAILKLQSQVDDLQKFQDLAKATNRLVRKNDRAGLAALGYSEARIDRFFVPDFAGRIGFPDYMLTNNSANIRRIKSAHYGTATSGQHAGTGADPRRGLDNTRRRHRESDPYRV